jgi:thiol-disulfide isomerase/thioredoxin
MAFRSLLVVLLLSFFVAPAFALSERPQELPAGSLEAGRTAPNFTLKTLDGDAVSHLQFRGKVVFLNFWASWCPPCRAEMPAMNRLNEVFSNRDFVMLAVNTEQDKDVVEDFLSSHPHDFTVLLDPQGAAQNLYQVFRFPETFLLDKEGRIVERFLGARDWSAVEFLKRIEHLVKE